jgi:hypothetical protein
MGRETVRMALPITGEMSAGQRGSSVLKSFSTMLAVVGFEVCFLVAARASSVLTLLLGLVYHSG